MFEIRSVRWFKKGCGRMAITNGLLDGLHSNGVLSVSSGLHGSFSKHYGEFLSQLCSHKLFCYYVSCI